ncbi:uncharacterized protein LOC62_06G008580 [Vanrija pseudolonga]|uniref:Uncharacterized protein n=1 Tax=Vanrija pseudolonga TaxID=143232 RepID=A0AAF1BP52_9TREE|nr:hypothetical protein LOC62_06G008580 [Vanrija pseudolonga]
MRIRATRRLRHFHPDFTHPPSTPILKSSDGVYFYFPLEMLIPVSTFFRDIATFPTPQGDNVIPLYSAHSEALSLALKLVAARHVGATTPPHLKWPSRETLKNLSVIIDAYDLPLVSEALITATLPPDPLTSAPVCYERVIWAAAEGVQGICTIARSTALHRLEDQEQTIVHALHQFPQALHYVNDWRRAFEKLVEESMNKLRIPATQMACSRCFFSDEIRRFYSWGWHRRRYPECRRWDWKTGHWSRAEMDDWVDRLTDQLTANVTNRLACPRVAGSKFRACLMLHLDNFYREVETSMANAVNIGGRAFHPDFAAPPTDIVLQADDGLHFYYDLAALARVSSFFNDLAGLPAAEGDNVIPLAMATSPALTLALHVVSGAYGPEHRFQWPPDRETVGSLLDMADAYDLPVVATTLWQQTPPDSIWDNGHACFERLVMAHTLRTHDLDIDLADCARLTALHRLEAQGEWVKIFLDEHPTAMSQVATWRAVVDSLIRSLMLGLRGRGVLPNASSNPGFPWRWIQDRTQAEVDRWLEELERQLLDKPWSYTQCPPSAGQLFCDRAQGKLAAYHIALRNLFPELPASGALLGWD